MRADVAVESPSSIVKSPMTLHLTYSEVCFVIVTVKYPEAPATIESYVLSHLPLYRKPVSAVLANMPHVPANKQHTKSKIFFITISILKVIVQQIDLLRHHRLFRCGQHKRPE